MKQESNRQKTTKDIDGGLHPAVDGQSLSERRKEKIRTTSRHSSEVTMLTKPVPVIN